MLLERTLQRDFTNTQKRIHIKQRVYHYHGTSAGLVIGKLCFFLQRKLRRIYFIQRRRRLLSTTLTLEKAIRALAHEGVICQSMPKA